MFDSDHTKFKAASVIFAATFLAGCALQEKGEWVKPGISEAQWKQDNYECTREATFYTAWAPYSGHHWSGYPWRGYHRAGFRSYATMVPLMDPYLYEMCMDARGYEREPEGEQ